MDELTDPHPSRVGMAAAIPPLPLAGEGEPRRASGVVGEGRPRRHLGG
jgi:hypothetical protein